jgi:L-amino acid N-acyltransferase YncA
MSFTVRTALPGDAAAVAAIYAHHVLHGVASYDTVPPSAEVLRDKIVSVTTQGWPYLVAERGGEVLGYAYASQFRDRPAYAYACENSIYVAAGHQQEGVGRGLMEKLIAAAHAFGFRQMVAVIGGADPASVGFHTSLGFRHMGGLHAIGWKAGRWLDSVYMQLELGEGASTSPDESR